MKALFVFTFLLFSVVLLSCKKQGSGGADLYEASELALLMRSMAAEQDSFKSNLLRGADSLIFPSSYVDLLEAKASEGMHIGEEYKAFANNFIAQMDSLKLSESSDLVSNHNLVVSNCVACHEMHCGGPIDRIEKLYIRN